MFAYLFVTGSQKHIFLLTQILKTLKEKIRSKAKAKLVKKARRVQQRRVKVEMEEENLLLVQTE